ncbi:MOSC domain-containing protein [Microbacterium bovistercoris]|uniref:MOSC domain-containing protein n=1 Tax=Microbacterium bovistercoris TaxID=2293570 RepID=A0A371NZA3_9MICO|nr:MOSC domain-containing protein [Microbacterium bovistercoris]REJ08536.1 MOSC domain-containing protein [Microbacterium bovistercoris]
MPRVAALYRHPVKGFTPEQCEELTVQADGRIAGDRVLAFRFADAATPELDDAGLHYWPKSKGLALESFPALAALRLHYDREALRVQISHDDVVLADAGLDDDGRADLVEALTEFVLTTPDAKHLGRPGRLPLALVGDGEQSRFQDRSRGFVSVHSTASIAALGDALEKRIDDRRFRTNVVIDGVDAWDELRWSGEVRIGDVRFTVHKPIGRCLATHANPDTGERDAKVLTTLTGRVGQAEPTLGTLLLLQSEAGVVSGDVDDLSGHGGVIRVGDEVVVG